MEARPKHVIKHSLRNHAGKGVQQVNDEMPANGGSQVLEVFQV
jgi:hypothetical protein